MDVLHFPLTTCKFSDVNITGFTCSKTDCRDLSPYHGNFCIILEFWRHTTFNFYYIQKFVFGSFCFQKQENLIFLADFLGLMAPIIGFWIKFSAGKPMQAGHVVMCLACQKPCFFFKRKMFFGIGRFLFSLRGKVPPSG